MNPPPASGVPLDPALAARLQRMSAARSGGPAGSPASPSGSGNRRRRRHAAKRSRRAALALSLSTAAGLTYGFWAMDGTTGPASAQTAAIVGSTAPLDTSGRVGASLGKDPVAATSTAAAPTTAAANTVVNGGVYRNKFGDVQVQVEFAADGSIVNSGALQTPYMDGKSVRINDQAVPVLDSEVITAQSAQVHSVSGATYTSHDYQRSVQSAIDAARAAGITQIA